MGNWLDYSHIGFRVLLVPSSPVIFFTNPPILAEVNARINSIATIDISTPCQSKTLFKKDSLFQFVFSSIILLLGSLVVLFNGYNAVQNIGYLKFLSSLLPGKSVYLFIFLSRFIFLTLSFLFIFLLMLGWVLIEGVRIPPVFWSILPGYIIAALLIILFSLAIGTIIGSLRKKSFASITTLIAAWISFVFIIPFAYNSYVENKGDQISSFYKAYERKHKIIDDFEKKAVKEHGRFEDNTMEENREVIEGYWNNEFKQVEAVDDQLKNEIDDVIKSCNNLGLWFPTTFYNLVSEELSSRGYQSYRDFYSSLIILRRQFARHWFDHVYYKDPKILVNFVKQGENLYHARSRLPGNFWIGVLINCGWVILTLLLGNFLFKRRMFPVLKNPEETDEFKLALLKGDKVTLETYAPEMIDQFNNVLNGQLKSFKGQILIDDIDITTGEKENFLSLCTPDQFPEDLKPLYLLEFLKRTLKLTAEEFNELKQSAGPELLKKPFADLDTKQKINILLAIINLDKWPIILLHDLTFGLKLKEAAKISEKIMAMELDNTLIIDIVTKGDVWFTPDITYRIKKKNGKYRVI
jgi:hypothetical protein